jgi:hypothetical protein
MCRLTIVGIALVVRYGPKADTKYADGFENFHAVTFDVFDVLNATFCARDFTQRSLALGKRVSPQIVAV